MNILESRLIWVFCDKKLIENSFEGQGMQRFGQNNKNKKIIVDQESGLEKAAFFKCIRTFMYADSDQKMFVTIMSNTTSHPTLITNEIDRPIFTKVINIF